MGCSRCIYRLRFLIFHFAVVPPFFWRFFVFLIFFYHIFRRLCVCLCSEVFFLCFLCYKFLFIGVKIMNECSVFLDFNVPLDSQVIAPLSILFLRNSSTCFIIYCSK